MKRLNREESLNRLFDLVDVDHDGTLNAEELVAAAPKLEITEEQARKLFHLLDADGDGRLSRAEFSTFKTHDGLHHTNGQRRLQYDPRLDQPWLTRVPNTAFGVALGLGGNATMWKVMSLTPFTAHVGESANWLFWVAGLGVLAAVAALYVLKAVHYPTLCHTEWAHPVRAHFFNAPHIAVLILAGATPASVRSDPAVLRTVWCLCLAAQVLLTQKIYGRWLFGAESNIGHARAPYLLSTVGWLLLTALGQPIEVDATFGLDLTVFCFGAGCCMYCLVVVSVFLAVHEANGEKGSPAMFLLLAPASVASMDLAGYSPEADGGGGGGHYGHGPSAIFGFCIVVLFFLLGMGPRVISKPSVFGTYWAYVFPLAALASVSVKYGRTKATPAAEGLAWAFVALATTALCVVFFRMMWFQVGVCNQTEFWGDPIVVEWQRRQGAGKEAACTEAERRLQRQFSSPGQPGGGGGAAAPGTALQARAAAAAAAATADDESTPVPDGALEEVLEEAGDYGSGDIDEAGGRELGLRV